MAAPYPYPNSSTLNFIGVVQYLNDSALNNLFGVGITLLVFIISLIAISSKTNNLLVGSAISGMVAFVISALFVFLGMGHEMLMLVFLFITMISTALLYFKGS